MRAVVVLVSRSMPKRVLSRKTSRGASPQRRVLNSSSAMRYAAHAVQTIGSVQENPSRFLFGDYDHPGEASLEEATSKAERALTEGKLRVAVSFACDISELLADMSPRDRQFGGAHFEASEKARQVAERAIDLLKESLTSASR